MIPIRVVSIPDPRRDPPQVDRRLALLSSFETTVLRPSGGTPIVADDRVRHVYAALRGQGRAARFATLSTAIELLAPDVIHLHAEPETRLAGQVAKLCAGAHYGLVLESGSPTKEGRRFDPLAHWRRGRVMARAHAAIADSAADLARLRRLGFCGAGIVSACAPGAAPLPPVQDARWTLDIPPHARLVVGVAAPESAWLELHALIRAATFCPDDIVFVVPAPARLARALADWIDAHEMLARVRIVPYESDPCGPHLPAVLAASDAVVVTGGRTRKDRAARKWLVDTVQRSGVPTVFDRAAAPELDAGAGWPVPNGDPTLIGQLLTVLSRRPDLVARATEAAKQNAASRHSADAAADSLARAIQAAAAHVATQPSAQPGARLNLGREPSRT